MEKIIIISGASSGIGYCIAEHLGKEGNIIFAGARKESDIEKLSSLKNVYGLQLDITNKDDIENLVTMIQNKYGHVDVLINNAGVTGWGAIIDRDMEYFRQVIEINLLGHIQMTKLIYPLLRKSTSSPIIINISSQAGNYAMPFWSAYHTSKWGLEAFSHCLRREILPLGIRVAIIQPGAIESNAFSKSTNEYEQYKKESSLEFRSRAILFLDAAFNRSVIKKKNKSALLVVKDIKKAIEDKNNNIYYQPGKRFVPDYLLQKLSYKLVDKILTKIK